MINLGTLKEITDLRSVWSHEALNFTPWVAENVDLLADAVGLDITVDETESSVGDFNVDIYASETGTDRKIIIENQLEDTDHDHLGKLITYASGKDADVVIWVVKHAREEHKAAVEWLNNHTDDKIGFFLCEIKLFQIGDSDIAPSFTVVERPNDWTKEIKKTKIYAYNDYAKDKIPFTYDDFDKGIIGLVDRVGVGKQNLVYCSSKRKVLDLAVKYGRTKKIVGNKKLEALAKDVRQEVHNNCYLADLIRRGIAYHVGYLPANIRLRIEKSFEEGDLRTIFCTSTLVEGVNLPADNLFMTSYKTGLSNMDEVEFRNLVGRVGRIKYNLYGNVFFVRDDTNLLDSKYISLLKEDVPPQKLSIEVKQNKKLFEIAISDLIKGDMELTECHEKKSSEQDYEAIRKFSMILTRDIAIGNVSPIVSAFMKSGALDHNSVKLIRENFPVTKTSDDITISYDQAENLADYVASGKTYPELKGENDDVDFEELVEFLVDLKRIFKWEVYERDTIGKNDDVLRWYAQILLRWIRGNGINRIIDNALKYKADHADKGVWIGKAKIADYYEGTKDHQNYVIAETLGVVENVLLFSISNYFRKFSAEYKKQHQVDSFSNDWYEYVEYGTTNPMTIFLQQSGFSREVSGFIQEHRDKYIIETDGEIKIKKTILHCENLGVETEANDIQFNMPELFTE